MDSYAGRRIFANPQEYSIRTQQVLIVFRARFELSLLLPLANANSFKHNSSIDMASTGASKAEKEKMVYKAKLSEEAERYDDMVRNCCNTFKRSFR